MITNQPKKRIALLSGISVIEQLFNRGPLSGGLGS